MAKGTGKIYLTLELLPKRRFASSLVSLVSHMLFYNSQEKSGMARVGEHWLSQPPLGSERIPQWISYVSLILSSQQINRTHCRPAGLVTQ
jgi:hypothetical protein